VNEFDLARHIGEEVYWNDPKKQHSNWYEIVGFASDEIVKLKNDFCSEFQVHMNELA